MPNKFIQIKDGYTILWITKKEEKPTIDNLNEMILGFKIYNDQKEKLLEYYGDNVTLI